MPILVAEGVRSEAFWNSDKRLIYCSTPKNASSSTQKWFLGMQWEYRIDAPKEDGYTSFAIIRDPVDRYVSGVIQYAKLYCQEHQCPDLDGWYEQTADGVLQGHVVLDRHTAPQTDFHSPDTVDMYVPYRPDLGKTLSSLLLAFGVPVDKALPAIRRTEDKDRFFRYLGSQHFEVLREFYSSDFSVWLRESGG